MGLGEGGEWYLSKDGGGGSPTAQIIAQGLFSGGVVITGWGIYIEGCPGRGPHIILLDYTRRIDQIQ